MSKYLLPFILVLILIGCNSEKSVDSINKEIQRAYDVLNAGDTQEAIAIMDSLIIEYPRISILYSERSFFQMINNNLAAAVVDNKIALELDPNSGNASFQQARIHFKKEEYDDALQMLNKSISLKKEVKPKHYKLFSNIYYQMDSMELSLINSTKAMELEPDEKIKQKMALSHSAVLLANGKYEDALKYLKISEPTKSEDLIYNNNRGFILSQLGHYEEALTYINKAIKVDNNSSYPYNNRGNIYLIIGDTIQACKDWNESLAKGYTFDPKWKEWHNLEDPVLLIEKYCK